MNIYIRYEMNALNQISLVTINGDGLYVELNLEGTRFGYKSMSREDTQWVHSPISFSLPQALLHALEFFGLQAPGSTLAFVHNQLFDHHQH